MQITKELREIIPDKLLQKLQSFSHQTSTKKLWGEHIHCVLPNEQPPDTSMLQKFPLYQQTESIAQGFSMQYAGQHSEAKKKPQAEVFNLAWLSKHVNPDLISTLLDQLRSSRSNNDLQNDLFELLGFDKFEAIQQILDNRKIVVQHVDNEAKKRSLLAQKAALQQEQRPSIMSQVIVQSQQEKQMHKLVRKDEKKLRQLQTVDVEEDETEEAILAKLHLAQQQHALLASKNRPLFKDRAYYNAQSSQQSRIRYPFVFDSEREAKSHVGFIAGGKMLLPENVQRSDNKLYEEVKIPAADSANLTVGEKRVDVSSLDEIGQVSVWFFICLTVIGCLDHTLLTDLSLVICMFFFLILLLMKI